MATGIRRVAVIGTGGSISIRARHSLDLHEYAEYGQTLGVDELLDTFREALRECDIVPVPFLEIGSPAMTPGHWLRLNRLIHDTLEKHPSISGIVITHGTDTIEETAYFLHLVAKVDVPVVLVASQRPLNGLSSDAGLNLVNATRVAAAASVRGLGVVVLLNDEIQSARDVTKAANHRLDAFRTPDFGILGQVDPDGTVSIYRKPVRRHAPGAEFDVRTAADLPRVEIVYSYAGAGAHVVEALLASGSRGIVNAGLPSGRIPPDLRDALARASADGVLVVQSSRSGSGRVIVRTDDKSAGFIGADNLNPQKARVLAMLALSVTDDRREIERMFGEY